jgi:hypothetical protein
MQYFMFQLYVRLPVKQLLPHNVCISNLFYLVLHPLHFVEGPQYRSLRVKLVISRRTSLQDIIIVQTCWRETREKIMQSKGQTITASWAYTAASQRAVCQSDGQNPTLVFYEFFLTLKRFNKRVVPFRPRYLSHWPSHWDNWLSPITRTNSPSSPSRRCQVNTIDTSLAHNHIVEWSNDFGVSCSHLVKKWADAVRVVKSKFRFISRTGGKAIHPKEGKHFVRLQDE